MSWLDQGRQEHGWFGHGTGPEGMDDSSADDGASGSLDHRLLALAYGAIAALPSSLRRQIEVQYHDGTLSLLTAAMTAWVRGGRLDRTSFANRFFGRGADDPAVQKLRDATLGAASATSDAEMHGAAEKLADVMKAIGLDRWSRFVADAAGRVGNFAAIDPIATTPVPFADDTGQVVLRPEREPTKPKNEPMMRPKGMDPHFFVDQGIRDKKEEESLISSGNEGQRRRWVI
jgi:hypothetical protein